MSLVAPLRLSRDFRLLFLSTFGSGLGTMLAVVALTIDVWDRTGSATWVSALLIVDFLPAILIGLLLGPVLDRASRRGLMVASDLVRALVFVALAFAPNATTIVALAAAAGFATGFFRPAVYAGLPNLIPEAELGRANSLLQATENATWAIGPVLGGLLVAASNPDVAYWVNAVTFVFSAVLVVQISASRLQAARVPTKGHWRDLAEGFALVRRSRALLAVLVTWSIAMMGNAAVNVADVAMAKKVFDAGDFGFGLLFGTTGLGLVIGASVTGPLLERLRVNRVYAGAIGLMALGFGLGAVSPSIWVAVPLVLVAGLGNGGANVCNPLLVQRGAPDELRGRAFTVIMSANYLMLGLAMAAAGPFTNAAGARWAWGASAAAFVVAAIFAFVLTPSFTEAAPGEPLPTSEPAPLGVGNPGPD